jgi:hypothetical protein
MSREICGLLGVSCGNFMGWSLRVSGSWEVKDVEEVKEVKDRSRASL